MKYKKYPSYKDSGISWLGEIPKHWNQRKIKHFAQTIPGGTPSTIEPEYWDGDIPWLPSGAVQNCIINEDRVIKFITKKGLYNSATKYIKPNSTLIALTGATCGNIGYLTFQSTANQSVVGIVTQKSTSDKYVFYSLISQKSQILVKRTGGAQAGINEQDVKDIFISYPPIQEQQQIANFLDKATAKIDTLIEKQTKQIELLKEKRQAVISHAVTKGIKSNVKMKDSGVEWLGEIPEHWEVTKLKFYVNVKGRIGFRGYTKDDLVSKEEGALVIGASEMNNNAKLEIKNPQYISWYKYYESPEIILTQGDLLFVQRGSTVGKVAHIDFDIEKATINPSLVVLKRIKLNPSYLKYYLLSHLIKSIVKVETSNTAIPMISQEQIGNYTLSIPKKESDQQQIVNYLEEKTSKIDTLIEKSNKSIELLKEKRTALISAAVTGKIDVREKV